MPNRVSLILLAIMCALVSATRADDPRNPNIVFIFADDWGWGDLSCHGSKIYRTPHLDALAKAGTDFHRFTVASGVCSPSRTAIMTGHYPARYCIHRHFSDIGSHQQAGMPDWLPADGPMFPRLLQKAGYATAHFGKWHLTSGKVADAPAPDAYGYDESAVFNGLGPQVNANPNRDEPLSTDKAIDFIRRHQDKPFFINLWVHATHTPHYPTERWLKKFEHLDERQRVYAAVVAEADERIGQVMATLDELGLTDRTLVIFSSDNGPERTGKRKEQGDEAIGRGLSTFYSVGGTAGLRGQKRSLYDGGVGVPFLVRWPGHTPAGAVDMTSTITGVDILPTLCAVAGVELPEGYEPDGVNVVPALRGKSFTRERPIYTEWQGPAAGQNWPRLGVRDGRWTLLMNYDGSRIELYDTDADRAQARDLAKDQPDVTRRLRDALMTWKRSLPTEPPAEALSKSRKPQPKNRKER